MYIFVSILIKNEMETKTKLTLKNTGKTTKTTFAEWIP